MDFNFHVFRNGTFEIYSETLEAAEKIAQDMLSWPQTSYTEVYELDGTGSLQQVAHFHI